MWRRENSRLQNHADGLSHNVPSFMEASVMNGGGGDNIISRDDNNNKASSVCLLFTQVRK